MRFYLPTKKNHAHIVGHKMNHLYWLFWLIGRAEVIFDVHQIRIVIKYCMNGSFLGINPYFEPDNELFNETLS